MSIIFFKEFVIMVEMEKARSRALTQAIIRVLGIFSFSRNREITKSSYRTDINVYRKYVEL